MSKTSTTFVFYNLAGELLSDLEITLRREGEKDVLNTRPEFDPETVSYRYDDLEPDRYHLTVSGPQIRGEERTVTVKESRHRHDLMLAQGNQDYYPFGNQRIYFERDEGSLAVKLGSRGKTSDTETLDDVLKDAGLVRSGEDNPEPGGIIRIARNTDAADLHERLQRKGLHAKVGALVELAPGKVGMLDGQAYVRTRELLTKEQVARLVEPFGFTVLDSDYYDPQAFILLYEDRGMSYELIDRCKELAEMDEFSSVSPSIVVPEEPEAPAYPGDLLSYTQWHLDVMRLPYAWELLQLQNINLTYGSADVIVAIHDSGIETTGGALNPTTPNPQHHEFQGLVTGGNLSALIGNSNKAYFTFDYTQDLGATKNIQPNNDAINDEHGTGVCALATARTDGTTGVVGVAPNTRLASMMYLLGGVGNLSLPTRVTRAHAFLYTSGMYPAWSNDAVNYAGATFPAPFGTNANIGPGAHTINMSHSYGGSALTNPDGTAMGSVTRFARNRRGVVMVASAGNQDQNFRVNSKTLGSDTHTLIVAGSTLDNYGRETRAPYSNFDNLLIDPGIDVCAPVDSTGPTTVHNPPLRYGVISAHRVGAGNQRGVVTLDVAIVNSPGAGTNQVQIPAANFAAFSVGDHVVIRQAAAPFKGELHRIAVKTAPDMLTLSNNLAIGYVAGARFIRAITNDYRNDFDGTSSAAPMVTGVVALLLSANPSLTWLEARDILRRTSIPIGLRYKGFNNRHRWVELNAAGTAAAGNLLTANDTLDVQGADQFVNFVNLPKGTTQINIGNTAAYTKRSTILIGAETLTTANPLAAGAVNIPVADTSGFAHNDQIIIGSLAETYISDLSGHGGLPGNSATAGSQFIHVQSTSGFREGEEVIINPGAPIQEIRTIRTAGGGFPGGYYAAGGGESFTIIFTAVLTNTHPVGTRVIVRKRETATISGAPAGGVIHIAGAGLAQSHAQNTLVTRLNTETRVVLDVLNGSELRIDPLEFPLNGNIKTRRGRRADYNYGLGYGRVDAEAAVRMALNFTHDERDAMIRNFIGDDGVLNRGAQPVHSPDLWVTNGASTPAASASNYGQSGPHEHPRTKVSAPVFVGSGLNDMASKGSYNGGGIATYTITISATGAPDKFTWQKDGGVVSASQNIVAGDIAVAEDLKISFGATTGHTAGDKWLIRVEALANRYVHVRVANRGTMQLFPRSVGANALPVNYYRLLLCLTNGTPVCRFYGRGLNNLQVMTAYTGLTKDVFTIQLVAPAGPGLPDRLQWAKGNAIFGAPVAITAGVPQALSHGVSIQFDTDSLHTVGDIWVLRCYPAAQSFVNINHYVESNSAPVFSLTSNRPGTWLVAEKELDRLTAGQKQYYFEPWPEAERPTVNGPALAPPALPLRLFLLGEVIPHDGKLMGDIPEQDNNFSYREIIFARFGFKKGSINEEVASYIEVDSFGTVANEAFTVQIISDVSTYRSESVRLEFVAELDNGTTEAKIFEFNGASWIFAGGAPSWCTMAGSPKRADGVTNATGEQYYMTFSGTLNASRAYKNIKITPKIYSAVNAAVVLAEESRTVAVYEQAQLASGRYTGISPADLAPHSHFFTDIGAVLVAQNAAIAYGPVSGDVQNKFRVTGLFKATSDVNAYAVVDGIFMIQRVADPNTPGTYLPDVINLVLKPYKQAMLGFTPVKYFIYRNLRLDNFLKGTSATDEKLVHDQGTATPFIQSLWALHTAQNGAVPFESLALGFDPPNQAGGDKIDKLFHRQDPNKQLPFVTRGTNMGKFYTNGGADEFGLEIILEEGEFQPDYNYVRRYKDVKIDISALVTPTPFDIRLEREKILNYIDPAAFFGMHMAKDGWLQVDDGAGNKTRHTGVAIYDNVISKFHTKNTLYVDVRNENGFSLNFYEEYDDSGNALDVGNVSTSLTAQKYETDKWPLLIRASSSAANTKDYNTVFLRFLREYNKKPILYLEHAQSDGSTTKGRFIAGTDLIAVAATKTNILGFRFPNKDLGAGNCIGAAWLLKLHYTMRQDAANIPFPAKVVPTATYLDNLFGPVDIDPLWAVNDPVIAWISAQDKKYVDGDGIAGLGFEHMADRGVAFSQWTGITSTTGTALFYAAAKDSFENANKKFIPHNGLTGGISKRGSFFEEAMLFDGYTVGFDVIVDGGTEVLTMSLQEMPPDPRPAEAMLLLGLTRNELETHLKPIAGFDNRYPRTLMLQEVPGSPFTDINGEQYRKYKVGLRGMKSDGTAHQAFPGTDVIVYTSDQKFFFSHAFTQAQPLPTAYMRNYEEAFGLLMRMGTPHTISAAAGNTVTVSGKDLRREIVPGDKVNINGTDRIVSTVAFSGGNSVITLTTAPGAIALGTDKVREPNKPFEDYFIAKDRLGVLSGIDRMEALVNDFVTGVNAIPDDSAAPAAIEALINNYAPKILQRARLICNDTGFSYPDDRILYWARIKMMANMKNHPYLIRVLVQRNRLEKLFETKSRGFDSVSFAGAGGRKKVLITGYDPFQIGSNPKRSNPSGATVLAMHGQNFTQGASNIHVQTAIFPVRFADFDQNPAPNAGTGVVESFIERFINPGHPNYVAADVPDVIVTLSQGGRFQFWLERFAGRTRGNVPDNLNIQGAQLPNTVPGDEFYETTLPELKIVPANNTAGVFRIYYNNKFEYTWMNGGVLTKGEYLPATQTDNTVLKIEDPSHPDHASLQGAVPSALTNTTTPKKTEITSVQGSGSNYLSNEIYYRVARLRQIYNPAMKTGHYHLPAIQHAGTGEFASLVNPAITSTQDFSPDLTRQLIEEVRNSLLRIFL